jgi:DNA polymerase III subunit beta
MVIVQTSQQQLLAALQSVSGIVERKHTLPILANVLLRKIGGNTTLTTSDLEIQIKTEAALAGDDGSFNTTIAARKLIEILRTMAPDQQVSIETQQNRVMLKGGKSKFVLQTLAAEDFPLVQESSTFGPAFALPQKVLRNLMNQVSFSMAVQDIRYYLNGILFVTDGKKLSLVATDGHRLAYASADLEVECPKQEVILPRKTVLELQRLLRDSDDPMELQFAANQARFRFDSKEFITKLVEGKFPDYNRVIPQNHRHEILFSRTALLAALQRTAILTSEKFKGVRVNLEPGSLRVTANNAEQEEAYDEIDVDYNAEPIEMGFNVLYLIDVLNTLSADILRIQLSDGNSSALFTLPDSTHFKYVVMPMRI